MMIARLAEETAASGLMIMGSLDEIGGTLILLGAAPDFWSILKAAPEWRDGRPDPVDRYSQRVVDAIARNHGAGARFPFGGPPHEPFIDWALRSGRAWKSPTGMLVHDRAGLMISYRGALEFAKPVDTGTPSAPSPCDACGDRPCADACPVGALSATTAYDVAACHAFLDTGPGRDCMVNGCAARRACPVSRRFGRDPAQSAHHMRAFHPS